MFRLTYFKRLLLVIMALILVACSGGEEEAPASSSSGDSGSADETNTDPIKIGAIHDLTGPTSDVGTPYAEGIRDYVKFINENGGVGGRQIDLLSQDYAYSVPEADQLYSQYVSEGVVAFQGWGTGDTEALKGKIADDEIPFMSASYSAPLGHPEEAPYNFLVGTSYSDQFIIALKHAKEDGADTVVILHHDSPFGTSPVQDGIDWGNENGMTVTSIPMPGGATDFTAELTQVKDTGAQYIVIQNVSSPSATLTKDVARLGMDIGIICLNWCSDELFIELAGDAAEGVIAASPFAFPSSDAALIESEIRPWAEANGIDVDAKGVHYVQGWTTMRLMVDGIRKAAIDGNEITGANIRAALETFTDYSTGGVTSPLTYTSDNHTGNTSLELYEVQNSVHVKISDYVSP
ncbi:MAG: ABC transporter substrate-binding protein [Candidatus Promineifilaceae bacterium]